jgi:hypothetical protein
VNVDSAVPARIQRSGEYVRGEMPWETAYRSAVKLKLQRTSVPARRSRP